MTIGERIKQARKEKKLSQKDLAKKLDVTASMIGQYENDLRRPKPDTLKRIADALEVNPADLDERLVIVYSDTIIEAEDGELITVSSGTREAKILSRFQALNNIGKDELIRQADNLLEANKFRRKPVND